MVIIESKDEHYFFKIVSSDGKQFSMTFLTLTFTAWRNDFEKKIAEINL